MKSNSYTGVKLDQFKDIKVGPYQSEVVYGSPSYEPYPDLSKEDIIYKGRFVKEAVILAFDWQLFMIMCFH